MKSSAKDRIEGRLHELKGEVKERAGRVVKHPDLQAEGHKEKISGTVQKKIGEIEKVFGA